MPTIALGYVRISDPKQSEYSLLTQRDAITAYCAERGYQLEAIHEDGYSGATFYERPGLTALRDRVRAGGIGVVVAYTLDRLSRNSAHVFIMDEECQRHGARLEFATERYEDTPVGRLIRSVMSFVAEIEREKIIERSTRGRHARALSGKLIPSRTALYGYQWRDQTKAAYDLDPATAPVVERIYRDAERGLPLMAIAKALTADGIPTPTGKAVWNQSTIQWICKHPFYRGDGYAWAWRPQGNAKKNATFDPEHAVELPAGTVPEIVTPARWGAVQQIIRDNRDKASSRRSHAHAALLRSGHARCGQCGYPLYVSSRRGMLIYRCESRHRHGTACKYHSQPVSDLDRYAWTWVMRLAVDADALQVAPPAEPDADELARIDRLLSANDRQRQNLTRRMAAIDDDTLAADMLAALRTLAGERRDLERERAALLAVTELSEARIAVQRQIIGVLHDVSDDWAFAEKRELVELLGLEVRLYPAESDAYAAVRALALH